MNQQFAADMAFSVSVAGWTSRGNEIREIRTKVFIEEQKIPLHEEFDEDDLTAIHVLATDNEGKAVGTARLLRNRKIGRVAVMKPWRGLGMGKALILFLMDLAQRNGATRMELDAQEHAVPFYTTLGYRIIGGEFLDAGIPHYKMVIDFP